MGSSWFQHRFNHYDWNQGVKKLQARAEEEYGHQQGYSGAINSCSYIGLHRPTVEIKNDKSLGLYLEDRSERLDKREGEVIDLGITGYSIARPVVNDYKGPTIWDSATLRGVKEPAILLRADFNRYISSPVAKGTVAEMKERAKKLLLKEKFENDYIILGRNISIPLLVTGEGKMVKSTTQTSNANQLVLPYHNYIVYGWAAE